jgi:hypothetical protein
MSESAPPARKQTVGFPPIAVILPTVLKIVVPAFQNRAYAAMGACTCHGQGLVAGPNDKLVHFRDRLVTEAGEEVGLAMMPLLLRGGSGWS